MRLFSTLVGIITGITLVIGWLVSWRAILGYALSRGD